MKVIMISDNPTYKQFYKELELAPDDWDTRLIFADWLEEQGESTLSNGQKLQVEHKKYPDKVIQDVSLNAETITSTSFWCWCHYWKSLRFSHHSHLTLELIKEVAHVKNSTIAVAKYVYRKKFATINQAETKFAYSVVNCKTPFFQVQI